MYKRLKPIVIKYNKCLDGGIYGLFGDCGWYET